MAATSALVATLLHEDDRPLNRTAEFSKEVTRAIVEQCRCRPIKGIRSYRETDEVYMIRLSYRDERKRGRGEDR